MKTGAVITAAGESRRMGGVDKVFALLCGQPVLERVITTFQKCARIDQIVVVLSERNLERGKELKVSDVCVGGSRRQDSVLAGLKRLDHCDWVVIHDGARPLVTEDLIERGLDAAMETGAAVAAVPVTDTICMREPMYNVAGEGYFVQQTLPRRRLRAVQTPQVFRMDILEKAYRQATGEFTDDASLVENIGYRVKLYMGSYDNIKITTPDDLAIAEILWRKRVLPVLTNASV